MGNGDPNCQESDKEPKRSLFNGLAQVIVQATKEPGEIQIEAHKDGWDGPNLDAGHDHDPDEAGGVAAGSQLVAVTESVSARAIQDEALRVVRGSQSLEESRSSRLPKRLC